MKKKRIIASILIIVLIIFCIFLIINSNRNYSNKSSNDKIISKEKIEKNSKNNKKTSSNKNINSDKNTNTTTKNNNSNINGNDNVITNDNKDNNKNNNNTVNTENNNSISNNKSNTQNNNNSNNNNSSNNNGNTSNPNPTPTITYYCPDGYTLNNNKCTNIIAANYVCPANTYDFANNNTPSDKYCVNLSDGYDVETDSCPENYGSIAMISFGAPTTYRCLKLYNKVYTCNDGYTLNGTNCIRTIDAQIK